MFQNRDFIFFENGSKISYDQNRDFCSNFRKLFQNFVLGKEIEKFNAQFAVVSLLMGFIAAVILEMDFGYGSTEVEENVYKIS